MTSQTTTKTGRPIESIDVHAHFLPGFYRQALLDAGHGKPDGMPAIPDWNVEETLGFMDRLGIRTAFLSISSPGVHFGDDASARSLARRVNEEGATIVQAHPGRFGLFASLTLPDVAGAVDEARHAFDRLAADGIVIETNAHSCYLGDPSLEPLWSELNRRGAVILIHPTSPACECSARLSATFPRPMLEFMFETTRSITDMIVAGVLDRYPKLRVIVPHAGAALPVLLDRFELLSPLITKTDGAVPSLRDALRTLHFDIAGSPVPTLLGSLLKVADPSRIHYGSDYPFTPADACENLLQRIEGTATIGPELRRAIMADNAVSLFPRLTATA